MRFRAFPLFSPAVIRFELTGVRVKASLVAW